MKIKPQSLQEARERKIVEIAVKMCMLASLLELNGEFHFGKDRLPKFANGVTKTMQDYNNRYDEVALDALIKHAKEKGIEVDWL